MCKSYLVYFFLLFCVCQSVSSHPSWVAHAKDIMDVLGIEWDGRVSGSQKNIEVKEIWLKFISSDMIDDTSFHRELSLRHKGFPNLGTGNKHRYLFHWGYDAIPWNTSIEQEVETYCEQNDLNLESNLRIFQSELEQEQRRRNKKIKEETEKFFGFASGGKDAKYARFFAATAYNIHILGDYTSDNTELRGLQPIDKLIGQIITEIKSLDKVESENIKNGITQINKRYSNVQKKADALLAYLKRALPDFLRRAQGGSIYRRLVNKGIVFTKLK